MKLLFTALILSGAMAATAQTSVTGSAYESQIIRGMMPPSSAAQSHLILPPAPPNQITINGRTYAGSLVQLGKGQDPLQLINPFAPPEYGSSDDNTVWDPVTGTARGLKLFSIQF